MSKDKMMVFGYARVSTDNQLENYSIEEQTARLEAYCAAKGWTLLRTYVDGGYSGGNTDRPALQQMLSAIKTGKIDAVVVYKLDRLSRSQKDTLTLIEDEFLAHGTDFVSINENFDTSTPFGRAMIGILSVFAQLEKDQITERFTMGRIGRGKAGYFHGGGNAPTGYDYVDGNLIINEYEAIQVRELFDLFLQGYSINAIEKNLNSKYTTKWTASKVRNVLKNSLYIGKVHFLGQEYDGLHKPLIDIDTFESANNLLLSSRENLIPSMKTPFRASYLLSGLIYCGRCGARYAAHHGYYKCYSRAKSSAKFVKDPNCKNNNWEIAVLDRGICSHIDNLINNSEAVQHILSQKKETVVPKDNIASIKSRVLEIDRQIDKLIELYQIGTLPIEKITEKVNALSQEKNTLSKQLNTSPKKTSEMLFIDAINKYKNEFKDATLENKRLLISSIVEKIVIDGQSVEIHWRI